MSLSILSIRIQYEHDVVASRQRAREVAEALGFDRQQQTRLATAVSEIARNTFTYGGGGLVEFALDGSTSPQLLLVRITDQGRGIGNLEEILEGRYRSETGMGLGIRGARRLMDTFTINTTPGKGTEVVLGKLLPRRAPVIAPAMLPRLISQIEKQKRRDVLDEFREQNQELMRTLDELRRRQDELLSLNRELEDTNRGVVALYAELDEKAGHLRRADEVKSRFLSNMSHEFRTPLNSILALSRLLAERTDGALTPEQETQVNYIRKSAESLFELVNDLLDLAKVEAGQISIRPVEFRISDLFGALRGMLRPLLISSTLSLVFEEADQIPPIFSDEGKISQILRNFISNALKFTEAGQVRVSAEYSESGQTVAFHVRDTGIGITAADRETIFLEFTQIDSPLQRKVKGTGLGLPLSRKLAELLGGSVSVESEPSIGSVFSVRIPAQFQIPAPAEIPELSPGREALQPILLVEDNFETRLVYTHFLTESPWRIVSARSVAEAENALRNIDPAAIILDILLAGEDAWDFLARLKSHPATRSIPVLVATTVEDRSKAQALGADAYAMKPVEREQLVETLRRLTGYGPGRSILLVDDEEISRYLLKEVFTNPTNRFLEASGGPQALELLRSEKPDLIVMDLAMAEMDGFTAIDKLRSAPELNRIPVVVATSMALSDEETLRLSGQVLAILPKQKLSQRGIAGHLRSILESAGLEDLVLATDGRPEAVLR